MKRPTVAACASATLTLMLFLGAASSPVTVLNLLAPRSDVGEHRDIGYGAGPRRVLNVSDPAQPEPHTAASTPIVVFFYGGGRESGGHGNVAIPPAPIPAPAANA